MFAVTLQSMQFPNSFNSRIFMIFPWQCNACLDNESSPKNLGQPGCYQITLERYFDVRSTLLVLRTFQRNLEFFRDNSYRTQVQIVLSSIFYTELVYQLPRLSWVLHVYCRARLIFIVGVKTGAVLLRPSELAWIARPSTTFLTCHCRIGMSVDWAFLWMTSTGTVDLRSRRSLSLT